MGEVETKRQRRKKITIFRMFLIPLIIIMLIQSAITIGTLVVRGITGMLEEYSVGMMSRLVENRRVILQNDMNQRWASICEHESLMNEALERFLREEDAEAEDLSGSAEMRGRLLERLFPECVNILQNNSTTGLFMVLTGDDMQEEGEFDGFFIRDSDPYTYPVNNTDLLLERGSKQLSREWDIPLDTLWTTRFHMDGQGKHSSDDWFYEPWKAGTEYADADTSDLGYWSMPFFLEKDRTDSYEMITYSLPLRYDGRVYGILGVEISVRRLYDYFPVAELNDSQQSGYLLAVRQEDGSYVPLAGKGVLYQPVRSGGNAFFLKETDYENFYRVHDIRMNRQGIYAVVCPLRLYGNNVPYDNTEWVLLGLDTEDDLFGISRQLYVRMVAAVLAGLVFGVFGIYFLVRYLTKPVQHLMRCISGGRAGLEGFTASNILEVDALHGVVKELTDRQKEAENILLEEKERYRVALESSKDIFFSYDLQNHVLDIVNHDTMSGQWKCEEFESGFIDPAYIYEADLADVTGALQSDADKLFVEFRMKWPEEADYEWVLLSGNVVRDTDGARRKLMGSIRDIQEMKEKEEEQLRRNSTDGATGLYVFSVGMECLRKRREVRPDGIMISLLTDQLKETSERNGIVFGDMILEELGDMIRSDCRRYTERTGKETVALRLNGEEFVLWLEECPKETAAEFIHGLKERFSEAFGTELFHVSLWAGAACGEKELTAETLIRRAKHARQCVPNKTKERYIFYGDNAEEEDSELPALQGREINSLNYGEDVGLVSVALNLFGKGADFSAQMALMVRKAGRFYHARDVLISVLHADFNSNYAEYQWHENGEDVTGNVKKYREEEKTEFFEWLSGAEVRYVSAEDSGREVIRRFLNIGPGQEGIMLPMYDNGSYMGNICILGVKKSLSEDPEECRNLKELGRVIQGQLNQQRHDIAGRAKSEFLSRMSHEIRTPMNGIIGMTEIALRQGQNPEKIADCLQKIRSSSDYLLGLINDILDMSKIESGKMKLEPFHFSMHEMLDTVRGVIAPQAAAKEIIFAEDIRLTHDYFMADRMRISQVLINLLGNAIKFTPAKGQVSLTVKESEGSVFFAVSDTGIGIPKEDQERVFRSFEQASDRNPSKQQGTGLGLSISSRLVQMMGSNIRLDSEPGKGSTFSFSVMLEPGEDMGAEKPEEEISFDGYRILIVEDNELNIEIARYLLEERGFETDCVYDGAQAVERMRTAPPGTYDIILMDILMPVMNGLDATRAIRSMDREDCRSIPIVAMSANAFDDDLKKSVECGMNGHLSKPVEVDKLYGTLNAVLHDKDFPKAAGPDKNR